MSREDSTSLRSGGPSHTSTNQWQSFEVRMRRRRAERCVMRAEVALEAGFPDEARAALEEARLLDVTTPDFETLRATIAPAALPPVRRSRRPLIAAAAAVVVTTLGMSAWLWSEIAARQGAGPSAVTHRATARDISLPAPRSRPQGEAPRPIITTEFIRPELDRPADTAVAPKRDAVPLAQLAKLDAATTGVGEVVPAEGTPATTEAPKLPPANLELKRNDTPPAPPEVAIPAAPVPPPSSGSSASASEAATRQDERSQVQAALRRYEAGFSALNVDGVRSVWPGVDARSLARAFNGLQSQRISLGECSVSVDAGTARAECRGTATWTPRIGGGTQTSNRAWSFELRNFARDWKIVRVQAR